MTWLFSTTDIIRTSMSVYSRSGKQSACQLSLKLNENDYSKKNLLMIKTSSF